MKYFFLVFYNKKWYINFGDTMKAKVLEKKIRSVTKKKDYQQAYRILSKCYMKHFKKMLKYKKVKVKKSWYMYDYLKAMKENYSDLYRLDIEELCEILYSKFSLKQQITYMIENCEVFNEYKW